jgi:DNA processing protein
MNTLRKLKISEYPRLLGEISDPPKQLYCRGTLPKGECKYLAVVGARKYSPYGKDVCEMLISGLRGYPVVVVSGLALGIDSIAHRAALETNLTTIAVPGSGLNDNVLYPSIHRQLATSIIEAGGALLSEFESDFRATPWSFPQRNRLMAGMSHAVLVIEAELKSGTLITSKLATDYNRDVLTVPGSIYSKNSEGPHMLLRLGATPITKPEDLLEALGFSKKKASELDYSGCSDDEKIVLELIKTPLSREDLLRALGRSTSESNSLLSIMELKGLIKESLGEIHRAT